MNYFVKKSTILSYLMNAAFKKRQILKSFKYQKQNHIILPGLMIYSLQLYNNKSAKSIQDGIIQKAQKVIDIQINQLKKEYGQIAFFPEVRYNVKGNKYQLDFTIDQRITDIYSILVTFLDTYEQKKEESNFKIKNVSSVREKTILSIQIDFEQGSGTKKSKLISSGTLYISGEMMTDRPGFKLTLEKSDEISDLDIKAFLNCYLQAYKPQQYNLAKERFKTQQTQQIKTQQFQQNEVKQTLQKLEQLGVTVFMPDQKQVNLDWDYLAGYEQQKRDIEDTVLLALQYPDIYDKITNVTRMKQEPNRPKAVLFEGPPGTGKTTSAKIIAQQVNIPLIYMPLEAFMSKFYGESEKQLADIWEACKQLGKSIIFIDEIDAVAGSRDSDMHEASRRILSTLLRKIDSFESNQDVLLICATNRKQDLDAAMLSRIDMSIKFENPDRLSRAAIFKRYAKHLNDDQLKQLADLSEKFSGRNISDVCKDAERRWASRLIRKEVDGNAPDFEQYKNSLLNRLNQQLK